MTKKKLIRALSVMLCGAMTFSTLSTVVSCTPAKDSIVIMTEELSGLFNPFYATSGADMDVVGLTQIGMLSTDKEGNTVAGDDEPTVVKDFEYRIEGEGENAKTVYTFVIKNNLAFSDGHPLTMQDVLFNMYEYLDPVYTGSSTMYSIDIQGLAQYRLQMNLSAGGEEIEEQISKTAAMSAMERIYELTSLYEEAGRIGNSTSTSYSLDYEGMMTAISEHYVSEGYKMAVASTKEQEEAAELGEEGEANFYRNILKEDYELTLKTFKEELESDFKAAKESYDLNTAPYKDWASQLSNDIFKFFLYEGYITPKYKEVMGRKDKTVIVSFENADIANRYATADKAIERIYNDKIVSELNAILSYWGTAGTLSTTYTAEAIDILLHNKMGEDGTLTYPNISGIVSLGHLDNAPTSIMVNNKAYNVANWQNLDENGKPMNETEYEVLQITVNGTDPKAIYSFGFTVAPAHYYSADETHPNGREIDIRNNKFGVEWSDSEFQSKTIQSYTHNKLPMGAGAYKATNADNSDTPGALEFVSSNVVYYKANNHFMFPVKAEKLRMQVISASNALDKLESGEVDYVTPQFTMENSNRLKNMESKGFTQLSSWQLGYGYIGINAGKVPNIYIRRAIMASMQTSLALEYYSSGTCKVIDWPMSTVSWAYPYQADKVTSKPNGKDYMTWTKDDEKNDYAAAKAEIQYYMGLAGVQPGDSSLKIKFTIAGASITEHPTYTVFKQASEILNSVGWDVEVKADSQALTKLSTGSLEVWAAAWGSTIDPDMYQVYHKNSSATSVYAWGYREIKASPSSYPEEYAIINELSDIIDEARSIMHSDKEVEHELRTPLYEDAMRLVLDLAVEMPVYQRMTLYAYNNNTVKGFNTEVNPYSSPLEKVWELELA